MFEWSRIEVPNGWGWALDDTERYFEKNKVSFEFAYKTASELSGALAGQKTDLRRGWSTWIFARLCSTAHSIRRLLPPVVSGYGTTIDHGSIASLARNVLEAGVLISYISEPKISEDEWKCRLLIFHIHDCVARIRLFKGISAGQQANEMRNALKDLHSRISSNDHFKKLQPDIQEKAKAGSLIYIKGLRSAAEVAGWDKNHFDAMYNYLSVQSHWAPMGFYRMDEREIDYRKIAPYQYYLIGLALELASTAMSAARTRMRELFPDSSASLSE
jgi:hypothetical protein